MMKNVKTLFQILILIVIALFNSCDNEGINPIIDDQLDNSAINEIDSAAFGSSSSMAAWTEVDDTQVPQDVLDYLADNYPDDIIEYLWLDEQGGFVVLLERGLALRFDNTGVFVEAIANAKRRRHSGKATERTEIAISELPQTILDYLAINYSGVVINDAKIDDVNNYYINLESGQIVIFDSNGIFIEEQAKRRKGKNKGRNDDEWTELDQSSLPAAITDYISSNHVGATIIRAGNNEDGEYGVVLDNSIALLFDANGEFIHQHELGEHKGEKWSTISDDDIPVIITDYIAENYPNALIEKSSTNTEGEYKIILDTPIALFFNANGEFIQAEEFGHYDNESCENDGQETDEG